MAIMESFVVKLGFNIDEPSAKRFKDTMEQGAKQVNEFRQATTNLPKVKLGNNIDQTSAKNFKETIESGAKQVSQFRSVLQGLATGVAAHTRQKLGFHVDEASTKHFKDTMDHGIRQVHEFRLALAGLALGVEESIRRTMRSFDQLYFSSKTLGVPAAMLGELRYGFEAANVSSGELNSTLATLEENLRESGKATYLKGLVPDAKNAGEALQELRKQYHAAVMAGGEGQGTEAEQLRIKWSGVEGLNFAAIRATSLPGIYEKVNHAIDVRRKIVTALGLDVNKAAENATVANEAWREFSETIGVALSRVISDNFGNIEAIFKSLADWLKDPAILKAFGDIFRDLKEFFANDKNREAFLRYLGLLKELVISVIQAIGWLITKFGELSGAVGPGWALAIVAAIWLAAPAILAAFAAAIAAPLVAAAFGLGAEILGAIVAGIIAAPLVIPGILIAKLRDALGLPGEAEQRRQDIDAAVGRQPGEKRDPSGFRKGSPASQFWNWITGGGGEEAQKPGEAQPGSYYTPHYQRGGIVPINAHAGEMVLPANISFGLQQLFSRPAGGFGGGNELLEEFKNWWSGDAAFRPLVDLASNVYDKLYEVMLLVGDQVLKAMGFTEGINGTGATDTAGAGAGAGEGGGEGGPRAGVAGGGRMPGRVEPGGEAPAPGEPGQYRPKYQLSEADVSDRVLRTIAGEATSSQASTDAVINTMFNRLGTRGYGRSANLEQIATAPSQFVGYAKNASAERLAFIKSRIEAIASGAVPDITQGANEFRTGSYMGPWGQRHRDSPVIGGNRFAYNPAGGTSPYAAYPGGAAPAGGAPGTTAGTLGGGGGAYGVPGATMNLGGTGAVGAPGTNLVKISVGGKSVTVNKAAAESFTGFFNELATTGYQIGSIGGFANRSKRGGRSLSEHAYGLAVDVNPQQNAMGGSGTDMPKNVAEMAAKYGLIWGGLWKGKSYDPMHFQYGGSQPWKGLGGAAAGREPREVNNTTNIHVHGSHNSRETADHVVALQDRAATRNQRSFLT